MLDIFASSARKLIYVTGLAIGGFTFVVFGMQMRMHAGLLQV